MFMFPAVAIRGSELHDRRYNANSFYAILYSFDPDWGWLKERQNKLEAYRQQGLGDSSRQVITETLNIMEA